MGLIIINYKAHNNYICYNKILHSLIFFEYFIILAYQIIIIKLKKKNNNYLPMLYKLDK